ncbi:MAG: hypothetical protein ACOYEV_10355 [Candidatus Nanopelagicales bacterium]
MTHDTTGRRAVMPAEGYTRPALVDSSGLIVTHVTEDGAITQAFDFSDLDCQSELLCSLVQGFAAATGQAGRWRSTASARQGAKTLRQFIRDIAGHPQSPARIEDLGPEVWWTWRAQIETRQRWPGAINQIRGLLADTPGLPETTRQALRGRARKPKTRQYEAYSRDEFQRIRAAASRILRTGLQRIEANLAVLAAYQAGEEPTDAPRTTIQGRSWTAGAILDHLARTGSVPPGTFGGQGQEARRLLHLAGATSASEALFPNSAEALSISFLLACERGYNPSVINAMTITGDRADDHASEEPVHVLHLDKPRRGPASRYSDESLTGDASMVIGRATAITAQARRTAALLGCPTDSLLLFRGGNASASRGAGLFRTDLSQPYVVAARWHEAAGLVADDGAPLRVTHRRLRLTEQVLNAQPRQNAPTVSETVYRRPDPQTRRDATVAIIRGQAEALEHAHATVAMRTLTQREIDAAESDPKALADRLGVPADKVKLLLSGAMNTAASACLDFTNSPFTAENGMPCPASFLACLGCRNAVATPAHLPRLVALSDALTRIGSAVSPGVWSEDYALPAARLANLLEANSTPEQREHARAQISDADEAVLTRLLSRGLDQ